jgi:hypothetical protein
LGSQSFLNIRPYARGAPQQLLGKHILMVALEFSVKVNDIQGKLKASLLNNVFRHENSKLKTHNSEFFMPAP